MPSPDSASPRSGQELYARAKRIIPGGTQLLSKRPEMFLPDNWPAYYSRARGCHVWDLDGRQLTDFTSCGVGSCLLGYADETVNAAVIDRISRGSMCTLNTPDEVALAETLCALHPWAQQVRYARAGGEAMSVAVRIARAATGRSKVAFCGYHGWADWYVAANLGETAALDGHLLPGLSPAGVPAELRGTALPFRYNQLAELEAILAGHRGEIAAIVMEPMRYDPPQDGFLHKVRKLADEAKIVLIFDEITSGWRSHHGGIHLTLGVAPDIAVFAKSLSNGFPMAAVIGREQVLESAQRSFISSTYWTEGVGPAAALATLARLDAAQAPTQIKRIGELTRAGWKAAAEQAGLAVKVGGIPALCNFSFDHGELNRPLMTLFTQGMLERGFLANGVFYPTLAHRPETVAHYLENVREVFGGLATCLAQGTVEQSLRGPVAHSGFARLT
jgi:glutamate-1-semialdehyde 2,1-aminomutase